MLSKYISSRYLITADILPFHDSFRSPVTVETSELALVLLDGGGHAVGEVLPAVRDHVPGDTVLSSEGAGTGADPGERGEMGAEPQVQGNTGAVDTEL